MLLTSFNDVFLGVQAETLEEINKGLNVMKVNDRFNVTMHGVQAYLSK